MGKIFNNLILWFFRRSCLYAVALCLWLYIFQTFYGHIKSSIGTLAAYPFAQLALQFGFFESWAWAKLEHSENIIAWFSEYAVRWPMLHIGVSLIVFTALIDMTIYQHQRGVNPRISPAEGVGLAILGGIAGLFISGLALSYIQNYGGLGGIGRLASQAGTWALWCSASFAILATWWQRSGKRDLISDDHIRGQRVGEVQEMARNLNREAAKAAKNGRTSYRICQCPPVHMSPDRLRPGLAILGSSGAGKGQVLGPLLRQFVYESVGGGQRLYPLLLMILDKKGEYTAKLAGYAGVHLLNPLDDRSLRFQPPVYDGPSADLFSSALIPGQQGGDRFWTDAPRAFLSAYAYSLAGLGRLTWPALAGFMQAQPSELRDVLERTDRGRVCLKLVRAKSAQSGETEDKMLTSIRAIIDSRLLFALDLAKAWGEEENFNLDKWLTTSRGGIVVLRHDDLNPVLSTAVLTFFVELSGRIAITKFPDHYAPGMEKQRREMYYLLDEFECLDKLEIIPQLLRVGRSMGLACVLATQTISAIATNEKYGVAGCEAILENSPNVIGLQCRKGTAKFMSELFGHGEKLVSKTTEHRESGIRRGDTGGSQDKIVRAAVMPDEFSTLARPDGNSKRVEGWFLTANAPITKLTWEAGSGDGLPAKFPVYVPAPHAGKIEVYPERVQEPADEIEVAREARFQESGKKAKDGEAQAKEGQESEPDFNPLDM